VTRWKPFLSHAFNRTSSGMGRGRGAKGKRSNHLHDWVKQSKIQGRGRGAKGKGSNPHPRSATPQGVAGEGLGIGHAPSFHLGTWNVPRSSAVALPTHGGQLMPVEFR